MATPRRVWLADSLLFLVAAGFTVLAVADEMDRQAGAIPIVAESVLGGLSCLGIWLRRRWPVGFAAVVIGFSVYSIAASFVVLIALFTVAVHRRPAVVGLVTAGAALASVGTALLRTDIGIPAWWQALLGIACVGAILAWGMFLRARRQLRQTLADRARQAEEDRFVQARRQERHRIAREMHDVLAHRLSLLSLHAGALELRPDGPADEVARAAGVIRDSAHRALEDLRAVIGVLRADSPADNAGDSWTGNAGDSWTGNAGGRLTGNAGDSWTGNTGDGWTGGLQAGWAASTPERPQPGLADITELVEQSRRVDTPVRLECAVAGDPQAVPPAIGRNTYRIVQEGLTNARKHASGTEVSVTIRGGKGEGLTVEILNPYPVRTVAATDIPGSGSGLVGLAERVGLAGGRLEHGHTPAGGFRLWAWLPWP
jgi:signal transduction histidine kinase